MITRPFATLCILAGGLLVMGCNGTTAGQGSGPGSTALVANICGSGTSSSWQMRNTQTGATTRLDCSIQAAGVNWGCYTSTGEGTGAIAELDYTKNEQSTYWNPGLPQNLKWFLYNDPAFGWKPIIAYILDYDSSSVSTVYYYSVPAESAGEPLFRNITDSKIGWLTIHQFDNSCQPYPGEVPPASWQPVLVDGGYQYTNGSWTWLTGQWSTTLNLNDNLPCDQVLDYCGPAISLMQHEGAYDNYTVGTWEKWWFSNDPSGNTPPLLKKVEQTEFDGTPDDIVIETVSTDLNSNVQVATPASSF